MTRSVVVLLGLCLVLPSIANAQTPPAPQKFPPDKFVNLQVLPKDASPGIVIQTMKNFTRALGVRCQFCHVGKEGLPLEEFDFASDVVPTKNVARNMIRMSAEINARITKDMPDAHAKGYQVTCYTCHRGAEHPMHAPEVAPKPPGW